MLSSFDHAAFWSHFQVFPQALSEKVDAPIVGETGFFRIPHSPLNFVYSSQSKKLFSNPVLVTWERFGYSRVRTPFKDSVFAHGKFIISKRVAQILSDFCSADFFLDPVVFSD
jgi:hypothetical protein